MSERAPNNRATHTGSALRALAHEGVAVWIQGLSRRSLADGTLARLVAGGAVGGAVLSLRELGREAREGTAYRAQIGSLRARGVGAETALKALHRYDTRWACDVLAARFAATRGADGWVCAEADPRSGGDAPGLLAEARALAGAVARPNLLVSVPATAAGLAAASDCLAEGIGVDMTRLYAPGHYRDAVDAYFEGLGRTLEAGRPPTGSSVASFDVARMAKVLVGRPGTAAPPARPAQALARAAYLLYEESLGTPAWRRLRDAGARQQRLLWPDAGEADPAATVHLAEDLVAWNTVQAMSERTLDAVVRQGHPHGDTLSHRPADALERLAQSWATSADVERAATALAAAELRERARETEALIGDWRDL